MTSRKPHRSHFSKSSSRGSIPIEAALGVAEFGEERSCESGFRLSRAFAAGRVVLVSMKPRITCIYNRAT